MRRRAGKSVERSVLGAIVFDGRRRRGLVTRGTFTVALRRGAETPELVTRLEDLVTDGDVEDDGAADADPDEEVVGVDADVVPVAVDPAPDLLLSALVAREGKGAHGCFAVDEASSRMANEYQRQRYDEGSAIANDAVEPPPFLKGVGAGAEVEDEEDVHSHGERPPGVRLHEPTHHQHLL